jgi:D-3-phosphoglycerate dehydrogenase
MDALPDGAVLVRDRDEIFRQADFITLHMAATAENAHGIGKREFGMMKASAYLINTARGSLVDEEALIAALWSGEIAGAGLDATEMEPLGADSPLWEQENVILTPHCGGSTRESKARSSLGAAKGCDEVLTGKPITSPVL